MKPDRLCGISFASKNEYTHFDSLRLNVNLSASDEKRQKLSKSCTIKREKFKGIVMLL
jgi:hypothetical protein